MLSKAAILATDDKNIKRVQVPEWGGEVGLRVLTGLERDKFEAMFTEKTTDKFKIRFVACSVCNEEGERLFSDADLDALGEKSSRVINHLFDLAWEHSCLSQEAVEEAGND